MRSVYRKQGSVVRWENGTIIRVRESGVAVEDDGFFEAFPAREEATLPALSEAFPTPPELPGVRIERLIMTRGVARHECDGREWSDETERLHCALVHGRERALIDLASMDMEHVESVARVLARCSGERHAPPLLRFAPAVTAAVLPALLGLAPPNVRLAQTPLGIDGRGLPVEEADAEPWPNWFRPSYRARPVSMPMHLRLTCDVTVIDRDRPVAVALLAPVRGLVVRLLVDDGERAFASDVRITRIDAVAHATTWYPYGGGSFGAEMML